MKCPQCQAENNDNAKFCKSCGFKLEGLNKPPVSSTVASSVCPNCGAALKPNAKFCAKCGATVPAVPAPTPDNDQTEILLPKDASVSSSEGKNAGSSPVCPNCGAALKPNAKFCSKCGTTISSTSGSAPRPELPEKSDEKKQQKEQPKKKAPVAVICIILVLLLLGGGFFALTKMGKIPNLPFGKNAAGSEKDDEKGKKKEDGDEEGDDDTDEEDITAEVEEKLTPIAEQVSAGKEKMDSGDYAGASIDLREALDAYAALASEYDSEDAIDIIDPSAADAFDAYTQSILKQVEGWEAQPPTAPLYQQIDLTMEDSIDFAGQLTEAGLTITSDALDADYAAFPDRYKEKYILAFNDLINGDWSRTTAWNNMQDAASVGLVDKNNPDDPLTLRYAYALAWITQKETSEGRNDGSVTDEDAITSILAVAESADYNPALMRELALCYDAVGDTANAKLIKDACVDVCNYLANNESVYINAEELFVPGKSTNASSTIPLSDFWYFNDRGEYSSNLLKGGVSKDGREHIRACYKAAIASLN